MNPPTDPESGREIFTTRRLHDHGDETQIGWRMLFETREECERVKRFAVAANEENLDRLEAEPATMA